MWCIKGEILGERRSDNLGTDRNILGRGQGGRNGARCDCAGFDRDREDSEEG